MVNEEKQIHLDAFETFLEYRLNNQTINKSINLVAEKYDYAPRTVWIWYKDFDWKSRERTRRAEINEITIKKHNQEIAKNKNNYLKVAHKILDNFIQSDFPTEIVSVRDLETVIKLCLLLQEEATEISKGEQVQVDLTEQVNKLFDEDKMREILEQEQNSKTENIVSEEFIYNEDKESEKD